MSVLNARARAGVSCLLAGCGALAGAAAAQGKTQTQPSRAGASATTNAVEQAATEIGQGCGNLAASVIRDNGLETNSTALGNLLYEAGVDATDAGNGARYVYAAPYAFVAGGVPEMNATVALKTAAADFVTGAASAPAGDTFYRGPIGGETIAELYVQYTFGTDPRGTCTTTGAQS